MSLNLSSHMTAFLEGVANDSQKGLVRAAVGIHPDPVSTVLFPCAVLPTLTVTAVPSTDVPELFIIGTDASARLVACALKNLKTLTMAAATGGTLNVADCANLTTLHCESNFLDYVEIAGCTSLTGLFCTNNVLTEACVDAVLIALDNLGLSGGTVNLSGGTNLPPSAASAAARTGLGAKSWTVTLNS